MEPNETSRPAAVRLPTVEDPSDRVWVFDLDNTLYPGHCNLFDQVSARIESFVSDHLKVSMEEARVIQTHYYRTYGTTLRGLMDVHGLPPEPFLEFVHDIDVSAIPPDARLDAALGGLHGRRVIFTNGSVRHAENIIGQLGIGHHFEGIFDIVAGDFVPKPDRRPYEAMLGRFGIDPTRAVMFEDLPRNLVPAHALGMTTVLVKGSHELTEIHAEGEHLHHVTDDLAGWLAEAVVAQGVAE